MLDNEEQFKKIELNTNINREVYTITRNKIKRGVLIKYITFNLKDKFNLEEISEFIKMIRKNTAIVVTIINLKYKEINLLFLDYKNDYHVEEIIKNLIEMEGD